MQGQMNFKFDQAGLIKAAPIALGAAVVLALLNFIGFLVQIVSPLSYLLPLFAGAWYVMTVRKSGSMPDLINGAIHGAILGVAAGIVYYIINLISLPSGIVSQAAAQLGALGSLANGLAGDIARQQASAYISLVAGVGGNSLITSLFIALVDGAFGAWLYSYLVKQGTIK
jgi:hypothetical protein